MRRITHFRRFKLPQKNPHHTVPRKAWSVKVDSEGLGVLPKAGRGRRGEPPHHSSFPFFPQVLSRKKQIIPKLEAAAKEEL